MNAVALLLAPVAGLWLLPVLAECGVLIRASRARIRSRSGGFTRLLVLVPAHDEEQLVGECLASLAAMRSARASYDVVVLADGCTDDTSSIARAMGATVMDHEGAALGKGQLLRWAVDRLDLSRYDVVVVVDADSAVDPGFADAIAACGPLRDAAAQSYIHLTNPRDSWLTELGALLQIIRYDLQYPLRARAQLNVPLNGNGMCFGVDLLREEGLPIMTVKEDLELYARLTARGRRVVYVPDARLRTQEPRSLMQASVQRSRWQAGKTRVVRETLAELVAAPIPPAQRIDAVAELLPVGPVAHAAVALLLALPLGLGDAPASRILAILFSLSVAPMAVYTVLAIRRQSQRARTARALLALPLYATWRLALLIRGLVRGSKGWHRTPRNTTHSTG